MVTATEFDAIWSVIGKIGVIVGAVVALLKGLEYLYKKMPVSRLEERVRECEERDRNDTNRLNSIETRVEALDLYDGLLHLRTRGIWMGRGKLT